MAGNLTLHVIAGPLEGQIIQLRPEKSLLLGRTGKGVNLPDPQVSFRHAEITWSGDCFWLQDLGSQTGSVVDGKRLGADPVALRPGSKIVIGESEFVLRAASNRRVLYLALALGFALLALYPAVNIATRVASQFFRDDPYVVWKEPIHRGDQASDRLYVDGCFQRETGQSAVGLGIRDVTDLDADGKDEIWLTWPGNERVYTFDDEGHWLLLGELPEGCMRRTEPGFPTIECPGGVTYVFDRTYKVPAPRPDEPNPRCAQYRERGLYRVKGQRGAIAWMPSEGAAGPVPYEFVLVENDLLAGFLDERGVDEAIHFLVCEDAIPGIGAQVLLESGEIRRLFPGCVRSMHLDGEFREDEFGTSLPRAMAFSATGQKALIDEIEVFFSGVADTLFLTPEQQLVIDDMTRPPSSRSGIKLSFYAEARRYRDPIAGEKADLRVRGRLQPETPGPGMPERKLPPPGEVFTITDQSLTELKKPARGCSTLLVKLDGWQCGNLCSSSSSFMDIFEDGDCAGVPRGERLLQATYQGGDFPGGHEYIEVKARISVDGQDKPINVKTVKWGYRGRDTR